MIRVTGTVGPWPVDLNIELSDSDWAGLKQAVPGVKVIYQEATAKPAEVPTSSASVRPAPTEALWQNALALVKNAGQVSGPVLFEQLEGLAGSPAAGKRLLVRLRHCEQVRVVSGGDAPLYIWAEG
jgi:hypothetical protein